LVNEQYFTWVKSGTDSNSNYPALVSRLQWQLESRASAPVNYSCIRIGASKRLRAVWKARQLAAMEQPGARRIRVMHLDIIASMIITRLPPSPLFVGRRHPAGMGKVPAARDMIPVLSNIYTQTLGGWSLWLLP
jgi:hypothetical protein